MYLHHEILPITRGRNWDVEKRLASGHAPASRSQGFQSAQICAYLGHGDRYMALRRWDSKADQERWYTSAEADAYRAARPPGLYTEQPSHAFFEEVLMTPGVGEGNFLAVAHYLVAPGQWEQFMALRRTHDAACLPSGGIVSMHTFRATEDETHALFLCRCGSRRDYERVIASDAIAQWRESVPDDTSTMTAWEFYEVVDEHMPGR